MFIDVIWSLEYLVLVSVYLFFILFSTLLLDHDLFSYFSREMFMRMRQDRKQNVVLDVEQPYICYEKLCIGPGKRAEKRM